MSAERKFTETEQQWLRDNWSTARTIEGMAATLRCRTTTLKREAKIMGLPSRSMTLRKPKASELRVKRSYHRACERVKDIEGEKSSPPPEGIRYACPGCGTKAEHALGHARCQAQEAA
jgi:hypothetical protein